MLKQLSSAFTGYLVISLNLLEWKRLDKYTRPGFETRSSMAIETAKGRLEFKTLEET